MRVIIKETDRSLEEEVDSIFLTFTSMDIYILLLFSACSRMSAALSAGGV